MFKGRRICVIVPAYNEQDRIQAVLRKIPSFVDDVIVVDDCSSDATAERATRVNDPRVRIVRDDRNQGVGGAMMTGFRNALDIGADLVAKIDGDGQMDPDRLQHLLLPLIEEGYGYAKGNRFLHSDALSRMPKHRLVGNFLLTFLTKLASGYWNIFDPQNGYIAVSANVLRMLDLRKLSRGYFFENDMLVKLNTLNIRVKDVPMPAMYDGHHSSMRIRGILVSFPIYLTRGFSYRLYHKYVLRDFSPIGAFYLAGFPMLAWGIVFGGYTWFQSILYARVATAGTVMLSVLPFLVGFELVLQGIVLEIQSSPR